jgi:hypothetical protein
MDMTGIKLIAVEKLNPFPNIPYNSPDLLFLRVITQSFAEFKQSFAEIRSDKNIIT